MEFVGDRSILKKAITLILSCTADRRQALVFFHRGHDGGIVALLEEPGVYLRLPLPGELYGKGTLIVSALHLHRALRTPDGASVHIEQAPGIGVLLNGQFLHPALPRTSTPRLPRFPLLGTLHIPIPDFRRMLRDVVPSISTDDARDGFNGIHLELSGDRLRMVTTDGFRLAWSEAAVTGTLAIPPRTLIPRSAARLLHRLLTVSLLTANLPGPVRLDLSQSDLRVFAGGAILVMPLTPGTFPDYRVLFPEPPPANRQITVDARPMRSALGRLKPITRHNENLILHAESHHLVLDARHKATEATEAVEADMVGEPMTFGLNRDYLMDVLRAAAGRVVTLSIPDPLSPCRLSLQGRQDCQFVIMPVQLPASIAV